MWYTETINTCDCGKNMEPKPCKSAAGWYLGFECPNCGPYDRVTDYVSSKEEAEILLKRSKDNNIPLKSYWEV